MKIQVKDAIADILKKEGTEIVFGHTGGHVMHMWEAIKKIGLKMILNKQEGNAVYMADGYTRSTNKPGIIVGTSGPGVQNMVTGLASAYADSIPLIVIGASVATFAAGRNALQESSGRGQAVEQRLIFRACCKQAMTAPSPDAVPDIIRDAFRTAFSGRKGPVFIEIPNNFWNLEIEYEEIDPTNYKNVNLPSCKQEDCIQIINALYNADHPMIVIGDGYDIFEDKKHLQNFLYKLEIPYAVSSQAKNYVDERSPRYLGGLRYHGKKIRAYEYMQKSDLILFLGDRMSQWELDWDYDREVLGNAVLAQIDPDSSEIGRMYPVKYSAVGSVSSFISFANINNKHKNSQKLIDEVNELKSKIPFQNRNEDSKKGINPLNLIRVVEDYSDGSANIVFDTGFTGSMGIQKFRLKDQQKFIHSEKNSPMGYSLPAAIGCNIGTNNETICFVGDGSMQMTLNELGTALNYGSKIIIIIQSNGGLASIRRFMTFVFGHQCQTEFVNPDFIKLAQSYNMKGYQVKTTVEFETAFKEAKKSKTSVIIDAIVDQDIMVWE